MPQKLKAAIAAAQPNLLVRRKYFWHLEKYSTRRTLQKYRRRFVPVRIY